MNLAEANPFSTRWTRPGALPYLFPSGVEAQHLIERLRASDWKGQITGPHGSGKSTLLATLLPLLERAGRRVELITLHDGQRRLPQVLAATADFDASRIILVDGYEQLSNWSRLRLRRLCARRDWGLVITAHADVGFPELFRTEVAQDLAKRIVQRLQPAKSALVAPEDVSTALVQNAGNMRETLFTLYDLYELRRRSVTSVGPYLNSPRLT
jgi:hypothetical protein